MTRRVKIVNDQKRIDSFDNNSRFCRVDIIIIIIILLGLMVFIIIAKIVYNIA